MSHDTVVIRMLTHFALLLRWVVNARVVMQNVSLVNARVVMQNVSLVNARVVMQNVSLTSKVKNNVMKSCYCHKLPPNEKKMSLVCENSLYKNPKTAIWNSEYHQCNVVWW
jgi:hypothetical protein